MTDNIGPRLFQIALFAGVMWGVFLIDPAGNLNNYGLVPGSPEPWVGIIALPFLHSSQSHIWENITLLAPLMVIMAVIEKNYWIKIAIMIIGSGALLWWFGPIGANHVGASCLLFAVMAYLAVVAVQRGKIIGAIFVAGLAYWQRDMLIGSLVPSPGPESQIGHLCGVAAGAALAIFWPPKT